MSKIHVRAVFLASVASGCVVSSTSAAGQSTTDAAGAASSTQSPYGANARPTTIGAPEVGGSTAAQISARPAPKADSSTPSEFGAGDIIVTAQKRAQTANSVGLSITAVSGDTLLSRGVNDPAQLTKLVSGFNFNQTAQATPVYTIRGVGYQDSSIAASPTVSVYVDEVPIPYSGGTLGASLDVERVEVLKGPQGTLYGGNSTGGAINYVAAKPTDEFVAGGREEFGRFATSDFTGYVGGPLSETLSVRLSGRWLKGGDWQRSYTRDDDDDKIGKRDQLFGRLLVDWRPLSRVRVQLNLNGWRDRSESQAGQLIGKQSTIPGVPLNPAFAAYPLAPPNPRAADWDPGRDYRHKDNFKQASARIDYSATDQLTLTSISSYQVYNRRIPVDYDASTVPVNFTVSSGQVKSFFQELRANLVLTGSGNITVGANYQSDKTNESVFSDLTAAAANILAAGGINAQNNQLAKTKAVFASGELNVLPKLAVVGGIRYTDADRDYSGCTRDPGDGRTAASFGALFGVTVQPGGCFTLRPDLTPGLFEDSLNEHNVSWRGGVNYKPNNVTLLYANVSRGFKAGAFQSLAAGVSASLRPVVQEKLTAYEVGLKVGLFDRLLQLNGAAFYYDYRGKQVRGSINDPQFGAIEALLNIPKSRIAGFELSGLLRPLRGLSISSSITLVDSKVLGRFIGQSPSNVSQNLNGQPFPYTPRWSGNSDAEYRWALSDRYQAVLGATVTYNSATNGGFGREELYRVRGYALLDLRALIEADGGKWQVGVFGRNVTNQYYWTTAVRASDPSTRFAGMPATYGVSLGFRY